MSSGESVSLIQILEKTVSPDKNELEIAQKFLEQTAQTNFAEFLKGLSDILSHAGNSPVARVAAGLQIKNQLSSKDQDKKSEYQIRWLSLSPEIRNYVKKNCLSALGTENHRPSSSAQCIAYIAVIELPNHEWDELIPLLTSNITDSESMREATLEAIGYICQDIEPEVLAAKSNEILTAIVHSMNCENNEHVRLAATTALYNSLEFTKNERHVIMQVICEATQSSNVQIKVAALQCLVKIMSLYYQYMEYYMRRALFPITLEAMKSDIDEVALQGIEFWSSVCDEESDLSIELSEAKDQGRTPERTSMHYAQGALQFLVPILMQTLTKQEEYDDDDDWIPSKAAGVCLMLLASCCNDDIIQYALPFIRENLRNSDWRYRDAAVMAFGSILDGPDINKLRPIVEYALPTLIELMYDNSVVVKDTTAWAIGKVFELIPDAIMKNVCPLLEALVAGLKAEPRVAANVCWAFTSLAEAAYEIAEVPENETDPVTYCLSEYFDVLVQELLQTTERIDGAQANLRGAAYESLMELIKNSPKDCYLTVQKTTLVILNRLQQVLQLEPHIQNSVDKAQYNDLQSLLCATLQSVLRKVTSEDAPKISDPIMMALLQMLSTCSSKSGGVQEDALMAVSTLLEVLSDKFLKYMDTFKQYLILGLKNYTEHQVCLAAVGVVGDICRAIGAQILPYCDEIITILLSILSNAEVHRSVKPHILSVFGDIALAIGSEFCRYLSVIMDFLKQAISLQVDKSDPEMCEYLEQLRESCLEAYTGIMQGLKGDGDTPSADVSYLQPYVPDIISFIQTIAQEPYKSDSCISSSAGLIGDLCLIYGTNILPYIDKDVIHNLLMEGRRSKTNKTRSVAQWTIKEIRKLKNAAPSW